MINNNIGSSLSDWYVSCIPSFPCYSFCCCEHRRAPAIPWCLWLSQRLWCDCWPFNDGTICNSSLSGSGDSSWDKVHLTRVTQKYRSTAKTQQLTHTHSMRQEANYMDSCHSPSSPLSLAINLLDISPFHLKMTGHSHSASGSFFSKNRAIISLSAVKDEKRAVSENMWTSLRQSIHYTCTAQKWSL